MENKKKPSVLGKGLAKIARKMGESSTDECWYWYHQPKVPESMKNKK